MSAEGGTRVENKKLLNKKLFIPVFCLQILLCLFLNWGGDQIVSRLNWPIWLDSAGTILAAYLLGPWSAAVIGATSNLLAHVMYGIPWYYALISILIGLIAGFAARRKMLNTLLGTLTTGAILAGAVALAAYPINLILNNANTGNNWGNAVIGFLGEAGIPNWAGLLIGELYVELLDKVFILFIIYLIMKVYRLFRKKQPENPEEKEDGDAPR